MSQLYFDNLCSRYPDYTNQCKLLEEYKSKKLYFQLTEEVTRFVNDPFLSNNRLLGEFYNVFLLDIVKKINPIDLVQIVCAVVKEFDDQQKAIALIESILPVVESDLGARCLCLSSVGLRQIALGQLDEARVKIDTVAELIADEEGLETIVYCQHYLLCTRFYNARQNPNEFYRYGVLYLKYVNQGLLTVDEKQEIVTKLVIAALVGPKVFNFAELLTDPICEAVQHDPKAANMIRLLGALNTGNMAEFLRVRKELDAFFQGEPSLVAQEQQITKKASIVALMELIFRSFSNHRTFGFAQIAQVTTIPPAQVELLVMRAISLGLVKGYICQVAEEVTFTWVLPRTLDRNQFVFVRNKLDEWLAMAQKTLGVMEVN